MDVRMPDGTIVKNVPDGTSRDEVMEKYHKSKGDSDHFRLGPGASSVVRPLAKGVASVISPFPGPSNLPNPADPGGPFIPTKSHADEFEEFLDKYTTKPTSTTGKAVEEVGSVLAGGLMPMGRVESTANKAVEAGGAALERGAAGIAESLTVKGTALREATRWGFRVSPEDMENPTVLGRITAYVGGRSIDRTVSRHNAERFDELGANSLGLPKGTPLTDKTFQEVRENAGRAYESLRNGPPVQGRDVLDDLVKLGSEITELEAGMPGVVSKDVLNELARIKGSMLQDTLHSGQLVDAIKFWRADATKQFKSTHPEAWYTAVFERQAADIAESALEKQAVKNGNPTLVSDVRNARKLIARSYALEDATNTATGHVNAETLATLSKKRPLDGELKAIADFAKAHRHSAQSVDRIGSVESQSKLRFFLAAGAFLAGHPAYATALAGEEVATAIGASRLAQRGRAAGETAGKEGTRRFNKPAAAVVGVQEAMGDQ